MWTTGLLESTAAWWKLFPGSPTLSFIWINLVVAVTDRTFFGYQMRWCPKPSPYIWKLIQISSVIHSFIQSLEDEEEDAPA